MDRNFAEALKLVLKHEGGWSDHPKDPGGATMKGVTLATFRRYVDPKATKDDLRNITQAQISDIYRRHYWNAVKADDLPDGIDYAVFDFAVNSGPSRAAQFLQRVVGVAADGKIGRQTLAAVQSLPADQIIKNLCVDRMAFLRGLKTWKAFGKGWTSRVEGVRAAALKMAAKTVAGIPTAPGTTHNPSTPKGSEPIPAPASTTPAATPAAPTGWLSLLLSLFKPSAPGGSGH